MKSHPEIKSSAVDNKSRKSIADILARLGVGGIAKVIAGNGTYVVLGFLANLISANGLSPAGFGLVSLGLAMLNVLQEVCGTGVDMAMVRLAAPHVRVDHARAQHYYKAALQIKLFINGMVALILWCASHWLASAIYHNTAMIPYLNWVAVGLMGAAVYNYMLAKFQTEERFTLYSALRVANNITKLVILGLLWWVSVFVPQTVMAAWIGSFFVSFGIALMFNNKQQSVDSNSLLSADFNFVREIYDFGKWVILSSFLFSLYSRTDLLILGRYSTTEELGQYAAAWNITFVIDLLTYSIIIALLPKASRMTRSKEFKEYIKYTLLVCIILAGALLPLYFLSDWFFAVFFPQYVNSAGIFSILFWGAIVTLLFHPVYLILYARNKVRRLAFVNFCLVVFCAIFGIIIIPGYGTLGAAWVIVSGRIFAAALICYFVYREMRWIIDEEVVTH